MNRIVRENYPVEKLPEDLRGGLTGGQTVTVTVEQEAKPSLGELHDLVAEILRNPKPMTFQEIRALAVPRGLEPGEAVARIRALRDEWDD